MIFPSSLFTACKSSRSLLFLILFLLSTGTPQQSAGQTSLQQPRSSNVFHTTKDIRAILQDKSGAYWIATDGDGVCRYDGKSFLFLTQKDGLPSDYVREIQQDKAGNLWFQTRDGICRYDGKSVTTFPDERVLRSIPYTTGLGKVKTNGLWFGTGDGAFYCDGNSFSFLSIPLEQADRELRQSQPGLNQSAYAVYSVLVDRAGILWLGTEQRGVYRFDGISFTRIFTPEVGFAVRALFEDRNGAIWFGNNGSGLFRYDGKVLTDVTKEMGLGNPEFAKTLKSKPGTLARVWSITEDVSGNLWAGTIDNGVWRYDGKTLKNYSVKDGLPSNSIMTVYRDKSGTLWLGTGGGTLCTFDGKSATTIGKGH